MVVLIWGILKRVIKLKLNFYGFVERIWFQFYGRQPISNFSKQRKVKVCCAEKNSFRYIRVNQPKRSKNLTLNPTESRCSLA